MKAPFKIEHEFVEFIPSHREPRTIYISMEYATAVHDCMCGCGLKVITPINPTGWRLEFDGENISLSPSVGNWGFPCRSHYWIENDTVMWAGDMSQDAIEWGRARDRKLRDRHFGGADQPIVPAPDITAGPDVAKLKRGFWKWLFGGD